MIQLEENQLRHMLTTAAEMGAKRALTDAGISKTEVNKAEAYRRFSRRSVDGWIASGKLKPIKRGSSIKLSLMSMESLSQTCQLYQKHLKPLPVT